MASEPTPKPVHTIIIDTGPIIKSEPSVSSLLQQCEEIVTIPAVVDEIRDAATRARFQTTLQPFLKIRSPRPESIKIVSDFARKTGDLAVLSRPDTHLLALAYEIECERNEGNWRLRSIPGQKRTNGPPPAPKEAASIEKQAEDTTSLGDDQTKAEATDSALSGVKEVHKIPEESPFTVDPTAGTIEPESAQQAEPIAFGTEEQVAKNSQASIEVPAIDSAAQETTEASVEIAEPLESLGISADTNDPQPEEDDEDSDGGWITPSNIKRKQLLENSPAASRGPEPKSIQVAMITTDFAMQNVLLQMNLNLLSPNLQRIKHIKSHILRCHACFKLERDLTRQFCGHCGGLTLNRVSCSTNANGEFTLHLKKNYQWNTRGNVYSVPKPVAGASNMRVKGGGKGGWGNGLVLSEDQKEYVRAVAEQKRVKGKDLMDEDYLPSLLTGERAKGGKLQVGAGRNVNSRKKR
ncbi:D-site 20S pre-rRNA nuclease [Microthyrium microscopicum]|uniref:20S-pre-rRNA D-site endonuclease NOB1 n=1 Tax=Microthyrium microscopicum TaxID=703497 RepID=A0A6A6U067_9PEZI|nr:D-site 20S pre-rRNA nuclease [Microthyrium microscopicum]